MSESIDGKMYIALAAPSGIGKTSLVSSLLQQSNRLLAGTQVRVEVSGPTRARLMKLDDEIRGHLSKGKFISEGIRGSQEVSTFSLDIEVQGSESKFTMEILDYPGGVLAERQGHQWDKVAEWLRKASVLILPIDATLLMEAGNARQSALAHRVLQISEMAAVAGRDWARAGANAVAGPRTLVLAPVKCESYFGDNGGSIDRSATLESEVKRSYESVTDAVRQEARDARIVYCAIDTLGCVEVNSVEWDPESERPPKCHYRVRRNTKLHPKGAEDLFVVLVQQMLAMARDDQRSRAEGAAKAAQDLDSQVNRPRDLLTTFIDWITGARRVLEKEATENAEQAERELRALKALEEALKRVAETRLSRRTSVDTPYKEG
jgi:hypothetical protein